MFVFQCWLNLNDLSTLLFSTHYSRDTGHKWFLEDAFQNEYRMFPGGKWLPTTDSPWADIVSFAFIKFVYFTFQCSILFLPVSFTEKF